MYMALALVLHVDVLVLRKPLAFQPSRDQDGSLEAFP
jgi:hypothetical protein